MCFVVKTSILFVTYLRSGTLVPEFEDERKEPCLSYYYVGEGHCQTPRSSPSAFFGGKEHRGVDEAGQETWTFTFIALLPRITSFRRSDE